MLLNSGYAVCLAFAVHCCVCVLQCLRAFPLLSVKFPCGVSCEIVWFGV